MLVKNYLKGIDTYEIFKLTHNSLNSRLNQILNQNHPFYIESHVIGYIHINTLLSCECSISEYSV